MAKTPTWRAACHELINGHPKPGRGHFAQTLRRQQSGISTLCISAEVGSAHLREIYLPAFETAVKQAKPWTVMCAYNKINGEYASEHHQLLIDILKNEWGFEGLVVSDWARAYRVKSLQGGWIWEMPGPNPCGFRK